MGVFLSLLRWEVEEHPTYFLDEEQWFWCWDGKWWWVWEEVCVCFFFSFFFSSLRFFGRRFGTMRGYDHHYYVDAAWWPYNELRAWQWNSRWDDWGYSWEERVRMRAECNTTFDCLIAFVCQDIYDTPFYAQRWTNDWPPNPCEWKASCEHFFFLRFFFSPFRLRDSSGERQRLTWEQCQQNVALTNAGVLDCSGSG